MVRGEGRKPQKLGAFGTAHKLPSGRYRAMYFGPDGRPFTWTDLGTNATHDKTWQSMLLPPGA